MPNAERWKTPRGWYQHRKWWRLFNCGPSCVPVDRAVGAGLCEKWEQGFFWRAWGWAGLPRARNVWLSWASIRTLSMHDIHWQVQGIALKETRVSGVEAGFQLPISSGAFCLESKLQSCKNKERAFLVPQLTLESLRANAS